MCIQDTLSSRAWLSGCIVQLLAFRARIVVYNVYQALGRVRARAKVSCIQCGNLKVSQTNVLYTLISNLVDYVHPAIINIIGNSNYGTQ